LLAQHPDADAASRRRWMWLAWGAMGVAVLTKGLIGIVLPGLALVVYTAWTRDLQLWRRLHIASGAALMLAIVLPWFWLVAERHPAFLHFFFVHEHVERYTSGVHQRGAPWWYFVPQLAGGFLPWLGLLPRMATAVRDDARAHAGGFSLSGSKLPGYILPMMPALALPAALALDGLSERAWARQLLVALVVSIGLVVASPLVTRVSSDPTQAAAYRDYASWLAAAGMLLVAGVLLARHLHRRGRPTSSRAAYALAAFCATTLALLGHETLGRGISGVDLVPPIRAVLAPGMPIYGVRLLDHTLPFYLQHTLVLVEDPDELAFGTQQEPQKWVPTLTAFRERWGSGQRALAVMSHATFAALRAEQWPMVVIAQDARRIVVANFPPTPP
jgi:4-amino-4-deoxy-L-arabinose transferase-like glycosyltransferase